MSQHTSIQNMENSLKKTDSHLSDSIQMLETRMSNIEKLLVPVIVDYRVRKELESRLPKNTSKEVVNEAQKWADNAIQKGQEKP